MKPTNRNLALVLGLLLLVIVLSPFVIGMLMGNMMASGMMGSGMMGNMMGSDMMGNMTGSDMMGNMMGSGQMSGWTWGAMLALNSLRMIAILAALIVGGLLLLRSLTDRSSRRDERGATALELLQRRYAAGDISQADYERMRQELLPLPTLQPR
jgi:uncharacterized membrane protein